MAQLREYQKTMAKEKKKKAEAARQRKIAAKRHANRGQGKIYKHKATFPRSVVKKKAVKKRGSGKAKR